MGLLRDYQALRWWVIPLLFAGFLVINYVAFKGFENVWLALSPDPGLSFLHYIVPGARETFDAFAACGHPELGSFYAWLLVFNVFAVLPGDWALLQAAARMMPLFKTKRLTREAIIKRSFTSMFLSLGLLGTLFIYDVETFDCRFAGVKDMGEMLVPSIVAAILVLVATAASRNGF